MKLMTLFIVLAAFMGAQTVVSLPASVTVTADGTESLNTWMRGQLTGVFTASSESINAAATTMNVLSTTGIASTALVVVDSEVLQVTSKTATQLTFTRAALGTAAASHSIGATVSALKYKSFMAVFIQVLKDKLGDIMKVTPSSGITAQDANIAAAEAAKQAIRDAAVQ